MTPSSEPRRHENDPIQRAVAGWSLLAGLLLFATLAIPFYWGHVYTHDDLGAFHLPIRAFYGQQLERGEPFDWMPQLYCGFHVAGEGQGGCYHPVHWLLYRSLSLRAASGLEWLGSYPFMLIGTWLFLRRRIGRQGAAVFGAIVFSFCGFNLLHFAHPNAVAVVAHLPWLLWASDVVMTGSGRVKTALAQAAIALLTASQLLLGYPQYVWFSWLALGAYTLFLLAGIEKGRRAASPWPRLVIAIAIGVLLGSVQLLPTIDALRHSGRPAADAAFAEWGSLHPWNLIQLVAPYLFRERVVGGNTHELGLYVGAVPLVLVVWLLIRRRELGRLAPLAYGSLGFGLLALLLAFGKYGLLYRLQQLLPLVGRFRFPCRYLVLFQLAVAVVATIGFVLLIQDCRRNGEQTADTARSLKRPPEQKGPWRPNDLLWLVVGLGGLAALVGLLKQGSPHVASVPLVLAGPLLLAASAWLVSAAARGRRNALTGLILLAAVDLGIYGLSYSVLGHTERLEQFAAATTVPPGEPEDRVLADTLRFDESGIRTGNRMTLCGWHRADGYAGLEPVRQLDHATIAALQVAGVRWVRRSEQTAQIDGLRPVDDQWLEVPEPLPRVRLVSRCQASNDPAADLATIDVRSTALTEFPLTLPPSSPGSVEVRDERPGRWGVTVDCPGPQLLVVSESFHPGWQAMVEGRPQPVLRVNGDFLGCQVGPGKQQVVLEFRPDSLHRGWIATYAGLALIGICFLGCLLNPGECPTKDL